MNIQYKFDQPVLLQQTSTWSRAIAQSNEKFRNTAALSQEDLLAKITDNDKKIAEIDSQLTKVIVDNQKRIYEINGQIGEIDSKLIQAQQTLKYQKITAPGDGTVFELKAKTAGFVVNSSEANCKKRSKMQIAIALDAQHH